jgi:signal transduction histidine kinase
VVAFLGALCLLGVNEWNLHRARASLQSGDDILAARIEIRRLQLQLLGAETAQRAYVITGSTEDAAQFRALAQMLQSQLVTLRGHFSDTDQRRALLLELQALTQMRLTTMGDIVRLMDQGQTEQATVLARSGLGNEHLVQIEALVAQTAASEQTRMAQDRKALMTTLESNRLAVGALLLLSMLSIWFYTRQAEHLTRERAARSRGVEQERDRLDAEVIRRTQELREMARHLQLAREDERSHLARELHDELGGLLTAAKLDVARLRNKLKQAPPDVLERLQHLVQTLDAVIALKRRITEDLRPSTLSNLGLQPALQILCNEFKQRSELDVQTALAALRLAPDCEITLFRVLQEGLTNITKYAQARCVRVSMQSEDGQAVLRIQDDGRGFDPASASEAGRGLAGMRFRLESCAGSLEVRAALGEGARLTARVPHVAPDGQPGLSLDPR